MAVSDAYATAAEYRAQLLKTDTGSDAQVLADLKAISRYIDRCVGRFFTKDAAVVARTFVPPNSLRQPFSNPPLGWAESENPYRWGVWSRHLAVDDIADTTGLEIVIDSDRSGTFTETPLATTDYELWPLNAAKGPEPEPYTSIVLPSWSTCMGFPFGVRVRVTAIWGWPEVPPAINRATCQLTAILRLESPRATSRVTEVGEVIGMSKIGMEIVTDLKRVYAKTASIF